MKLIIIDSGDHSVGIFPNAYEIDCPFDKDVDDEIREWFRAEMIKVYKELCDGFLEAQYSDEKHD